MGSEKMATSSLCQGWRIISVHSKSSHFNILKTNGLRNEIFSKHQLFPKIRDNNQVFSMNNISTLICSSLSSLPRHLNRFHHHHLPVSVSARKIQKLPNPGTIRQLLRNFRSGRSNGPQQLKGQNVDDSSSLLRPFLFTVGVVGSSFTMAMIWNYEKMRATYKKYDPFSKDYSEYGAKRLGFRQKLNSLWSQYDTKEKVIIGIIAANLAVFGLWNVGRLQPMMMKYFASSLSHPVSSMALATFSHISFFHLFVNMYVLWNFAAHALKMYGPEQFCAVYLSAGVTASFFSIACTKLLKRPPTMSVGASGAIMALLGIVCSAHPDAKLAIAFVDQIIPHSFSADTGMKAIILLDLAGLVLGWKVMDHAGHLGGMLFGILYHHYGAKNIWGSRESFIKFWHNLRGKP